MSYILIGDHLFHKDSIFRIFSRISPTTIDVRLHTHNFYEIVFVEKGTLIHSFNNATSIINAGDLFWICPGDVHGYFRPSNTKLYDCIFYPEDIKSDLDDIGELPVVSNIFSGQHRTSLQYIHIDINKRRQIVSLIEGIISELNNKKDGWQYKMKYNLLELLIEISRNKNSSYSSTTSVDNRGGYSKYVYNAVKYIDENFNEQITVRTLADNTGLSMDYFYRIFKKIMHISPMEYLKNIRLSKAIDLLKNTEMSITDISFNVGFNDPAYFSRLFKQVVGISPSEYNKLNK